MKTMKCKILSETQSLKYSKEIHSLKKLKKHLKN